MFSFSSLQARNNKYNCVKFSEVIVTYKSSLSQFHSWQTEYNKLLQQGEFCSVVYCIYLLLFGLYRQLHVYTSVSRFFPAEVKDLYTLYASNDEA